MMVGAAFKGDTDERLMNIQHDMYSHMVYKIWETCKEKWLEYANMYVDKEIRNRVFEIDTFDHRLVQFSHDTFASVFRFLILTGKEAINLFEPSVEDIKQKYSYLFRQYEGSELDRLNQNLEKNGWILVHKWHYFLEIELQTLSAKCGKVYFQPFVKKIINATCLDESQSKWDSAEEANTILKNYYNELYQIPYLQ